MTRPGTDEFTGALFDHYDIDPHPCPRIIAGSYLPVLDVAKKETQQRWLEVFGIELPEQVVVQNYVLSDVERRRVNDFKTTFISTCDPTTLLNIGINRRSRPEETFSRIAASIRHETYRHVLDYTHLEPDMSLTEQVEAVPLLQSTARRTYSSDEHNLDCAVTVFGMNAVHFMNNDQSPGQNFDSHTASRIINNRDMHESSPPGAKYDLPWMLGALTTQFVAEKSGMALRVVTMVGADLGEIENRVIIPLRTKAPDVRFVLNAVLASDSSAKAKHAVTVIKAENETLWVQDPKYSSTQEVSARTFWNRWVSANMQAVITVARPVS